MHLTPTIRIGLGVALLSIAAIAQASAAPDKGCLNCHGTPAKGKAPTIAQLAERYSAHRGNEAEIARLSEHLREHHLFGGVPAHERLSAEEAAGFVRWLVDGAP